MKLIELSGRPVLEPCSLEYYDYTLAVYVGCQHRCLYCYSQNDSDLDWDNEVGFIPDFAEQLETALANLPPQVIYVAGDTDPYQPVETELGYTRQVLTALADRGFSASILTKSDLVERDLDVLARMPEPSVGISIAFNDEVARKWFEVDARPTTARVEALKKAKQAGIETYVLICPVLPHFTDAEALIDEVYRYADTIWVYRLDINAATDRNWKRVQGVVREHYPERLDEFASIVMSPEHIYRSDLRRRLEDMRTSRDLNLNICL
jgi:DNA repair photolyase